jgi:ribosomal protein S18 acetylase RimI-like enzyme
VAFQITPYHPSDLVALYRICLLTGDHGKDASHLYQDPDLLGHYYVAPYAVSEPNLCFILSDNDMRCGYILGTRDSAAFWEWCEVNWFPNLRKRYPLPDKGDNSPDANMVRLFHQTRTVNPDTTDYPAHLHIDLLPMAQGRGWGHQMMGTFLNRLRELKVKAVHLGVSKKNPRGIRFYEKEGFTILKEYPTGITYGMMLDHAG